jgi:hypothetical protein
MQNFPKSADTSWEEKINIPFIFFFLCDFSNTERAVVDL